MSASADDDRAAVAELVGGGEQPELVGIAAASIRHASTTMSCVDEENATTSAKTPTVARPALRPTTGERRQAERHAAAG